MVDNDFWEALFKKENAAVQNDNAEVAEQTPAIAASAQEADAPSRKPRKKAANIPLGKLHPFEGHPYRVENDESMAELADSIRMQGILSPLIVRPLDGKEGEYEVISGHRRLFAAEKLGMKSVPAMIEFVDRDTAAIEMVDSNLHREKILPSERAFAFKIKMEALRHQGKAASAQVAPKPSAQQIGDEAGMSKDMVKRYIRLTHLIPSLLDMADEGRIALTTAVELSFLTQQEQQWLADATEMADGTPSLSQACRMKKASRDGMLDNEAIRHIMAEEKPNQREQIRFPREELQRYFPTHYTDAQIKADIIKSLELLRRRRDRDAR